MAARRRYDTGRAATALPYPPSDASEMRQLIGHRGGSSAFTAETSASRPRSAHDRATTPSRPHRSGPRRGTRGRGCGRGTCGTEQARGGTMQEPGGLVDQDAIIRYVTDTFTGVEVLRPPDGPGAGDTFFIYDPQR